MSTQAIGKEISQQFTEFHWILWMFTPSHRNLTEISQYPTCISQSLIESHKNLTVSPGISENFPVLEISAQIDTYDAAFSAYR